MSEPGANHLRRTLLWLAVAPLIGAIGLIAIVVHGQASQLTRAQQAVVEPALRAAREAELRNYVSLALQAIDEAHTREAAFVILRGMEFGEDGYFFVNDESGRMLMHGRQRELEGRDMLPHRAGDGSFPLRDILARARAGGGLVEYLWQRPSSGREERKLGYVAPYPRLGLVVGSGLYLADIEAARAQIERQASAAIEGTLWRIAGIACFAVLLVSAVGFALNLSDHRVGELRLRALTHANVRSQEEERRRVASHLHDGAMQQLASAKFLFESIQVRLGSDAGDLQPVLARAIGSLRDVLAEIRRISHGLRPAILDDLGLLAALRERLDEFSEGTGIATDLQAEPDLPELPDAVKTVLFRVAQQALQNAADHARARSVAVALERRDGLMCLTVRDDGTGFDVDALRARPRSGLGLTSMREQVEMLGGSFSVCSDPQGTEIRTMLPQRSLATG